MGRRGSRNSGGKGTSAGCAVLFGLFFTLAGGAAAYFIGQMFLENLDTYRWDEAPCELLSCEIKATESEKNNPFTFHVNYRYTLDGTTYLGDRYQLEPLTGDDYTKFAHKRRDLLNSGDGGISAWVDPDDRTSAILQRGNLWLYALMMLFPLPFLAVGIGVIWFSIRSGREAKSTSVSSSSSTLSKKTSSKAGRRVGAILFGVFLLVGLGLSWPLGILPIRNAASAKSWIETPCKIIWSRVVTHEGDDGDTYSVDIFYEYEADGELQRSNRYGFVGGSSSGRSGKQAIVRRYPRGSQQVCYVDPDDPLEAVLKPELGASIFLAIIPAIFALIGGGGLAAMWIGGRKETRKSNLLGPTRDREGDTFGGTSSRTFRPGGKRLVAFFIALGIALFWNGITSVFVWEAIQSFRRDSPEWFLTIFIIPFVLIGLVMICAVIYTLAMQFNPRPILTLTPGSPALGQSLSVEWKISSGAYRLRKLRLLLVGKEKATYRRGTNTSTDTKTFYRGALAEASHGLEIIQGEGHIDLPADLCPSLDLGNNEIEWSLKIEGEIAWWPDIGDEYEITIRPTQS
jgi:hypothetical protein